MIKDYKRSSYYGYRPHHRFRRLALLGIPLILVASGLYAALQSMEPLSLSNGVQKKPGSRIVALALPGTPNTVATETTSTKAAGQNAQPQIKPRPQLAIAKSLQAPPSHSSSTKPPITTPQEAATVEPDYQWKKHRIRTGDSLALIFPKLGLSANLLHRIVSSGKAAAQLAHIKPGETLHAALDADNHLHELILEQSAIQSLKITPDGDTFSAQIIERPLESRTAHIAGQVTNSLFVSAQKAGLSDRLIMELANIFGWDIDFALEIRTGDSFSVIYQEDFLDGQKYRDGAILAAEFVNRGKSFRAIRYIDETGRADYFSPDGKSVRKAFLRSPVDFRRISSRFQKSRWHPVLGKKRPHRGVDYAAASGTPIKASGDGKIIFRGRKGGYGRAVMIEHGGGIVTLYGHMSRYASKQRRGTRVTQGQIIGYVGQSGLASGPHLHYEFRINGSHRNPLTVKLPAAAPIAKKYRTDFQEKSAPLLARLEILNKTLMAEATP